MREAEKAKKKAAVMKYSSRHSKFGGSFVVSNVKSISDREVIAYKPVSDVRQLSFDKNKVPKKKPKNRKPLTETEYTRRSTLSIRVFLKEFCIQFLENCYNPLMSAVKVGMILFIKSIVICSLEDISELQRILERPLNF